MSEEPLLKPEEVAEVLSGGEADEAAERVDGGAGRDPSAYSLREPVVIPPSKEPEARKQVEEITEAVMNSLRRVLETEFTVEVEGFQQQRVASAVAVLPQPVWAVTFEVGERGGLALVLPPALAMVLVELALGGPGNAPPEGREPTPLENRVFRRLHGMIERAIAKQSDLPLRAGELGIGAVPRSFASPGETVGIGLLRWKVGENDQTAMLMANAAMLKAGDDLDEEPAGDRVGPLARKLDSVKIDAVPVLRAGKILMRDLMEMKEGAVLRFDVPETAVLDLRVSGEDVLRGRIEREEGKPKFVVTARRGKPVPPPAPEENR